jgi:CheY-like chemotaxis protein
VRLYFPTILQAPGAVRTDLADITITPCNVMLVDDEKALLEVYGRLLSRLGYRIYTFSSAAEALQALEDKPDGFDVLITDLTMPAITGVQLIQMVRRRFPHLPAILCTGYSEMVEHIDTARWHWQSAEKTPHRAGDVLAIEEASKRLDGIPPSRHVLFYYPGKDSYGRVERGGVAVVDVRWWRRCAGWRFHCGMQFAPASQAGRGPRNVPAALPSERTTCACCPPCYTATWKTATVHLAAGRQPLRLTFDYDYISRLVALAAHVEDGTTPEPGATPAADGTPRDPHGCWCCSWMKSTLPLQRPGLLSHCGRLWI